ncbi:MAG: ribosome small subunit-dependent GTPase A [Clostridia bacterium]|nr:ribosome small subunit-dependent GTPase A [Clostridia bacterium]
MLRGIGGFYYVETADGEWECKARGIFRHAGQTPLAGDLVRISTLDNGKGVLEQILPRKNAMIRPPVANLDCLVLVASVAQPEPHLLVLDKMIAVAEHKGIEPIVVFNKSDLAESEALCALYRNAGFQTVSASAETGEGIEALRALLVGRVAAFSGNSGVGKSSILNRLDDRLGLETAEISTVLGRGKHTTRSSTLYKQPGGGYFVDTPGFSSLDVERLAHIDKDELPDCFREFSPYVGECRFATCRHLKEPDCAIRQAVADGKIAASRLASYEAMMTEALARPDWEKR